MYSSIKLILSVIFRSSSGVLQILEVVPGGKDIMLKHLLVDYSSFNRTGLSIRMAKDGLVGYI